MRYQEKTNAMKTNFRFLAFLSFIAFAAVANAQFAIGLRPMLSNYGGYDDRRRAEISVMTGTIGERTTMEFDFGWGHRTLLSNPTYVPLPTGEVTLQYDETRQYWASGTAMLQWHHKILWRLYYYVGLGATAYFAEDGLDIMGIDVQLGLELKLKIPLQITVDYRPMLDVLDGMAYYHTVGLGVRYQFRQPEPEPEPKFLKKWKQKLFG